MFRSYRFGRPALADDPWGYGNPLEWATSSPPPRHNFHELPRVRSERPAFELHYPHLVERYRSEARIGRASMGEVDAQAANREAEPNDDPKSR